MCISNNTLEMFSLSRFMWQVVSCFHKAICEESIFFTSLNSISEGGKYMSEVRVKDNESLDSALRRFKRSCAKAGIMGEVRKREHYDKPSIRRKKKSEAARKRKFT